MPDPDPTERKTPDGTSSTSVHYYPDGSMEVIAYDDQGREIARIRSAPLDPPPVDPDQVVEPGT